MEEIIKIIKEQIQRGVENPEYFPMDSASWQDEEGAIITLNQAKQIIEFYEAQTIH